MSVHFRGKCHIVDNVECLVPCVTKWNQRQPNIVLRGKCSDILFEESKAIIKD